MLKIEATAQESHVAESLMDRVLIGMISHMREPSSFFWSIALIHTPASSLVVQDPSSSSPHTRSDYLETLIRDPTSSHLVEVLVLVSPIEVFRAIWATYFVGRLGKLIGHPVANFVLAKAVGRLEELDMRGLMEEIGTGWEKTVSKWGNNLRAEPCEFDTEI